MPSPEHAIRRFLHLLKRPARLLVAVSGGSDSLGLLTLLHDILGGSSADGVGLFAATVDHGLRPESAAEALYVASFCKARGIPHEIRRWQGDKPKTGVSAAAREARYALLIALADELDSTAILTGHTFDDQRETVAMRSMRSDDPDNLGLAGMAEQVLLQRRRWLVRPMLLTRRAEIRAALVARQISWIDDPSNTDTHYERVRTRQALTAEAVSVSAEIEAAGLRRTRLSEAAAQILRDHVDLRQGVLALLDPAGLASAQPDVLRHLLGTLATVLGGREYGFRRDTGDRVMEFIASGTPGRITAGRVLFDRRGEGLFLQRENRGLPQVDLLPGKQVIWDGRYRVRNSTLEALHLAPLPADRERAAMLFPDMPPSVAMRAMSVLPQIAGDKTDLQRFAIEPILAPFDRFLPQFDIMLAREICILLGCDAFPPAPVDDSDRKS